MTLDTIRYIGKESNNLDESMSSGAKEEDYLEYFNNKEFYNWILSLKPKAVKDKGISQQALYKIKTKIKSGKRLNPKVRIVRSLLELYKDSKTDLDN